MRALQRSIPAVDPWQAAATRAGLTFADPADDPGATDPRVFVPAVPADALLGAETDAGRTRWRERRS